jgi:uncharacterized membrane protein YukC
MDVGILLPPTIAVTGQKALRANTDQVWAMLMQLQDLDHSQTCPPKKNIYVSRKIRIIQKHIKIGMIWIPLGVKTWLTYYK